MVANELELKKSISLISIVGVKAKNVQMEKQKSETRQGPLESRRPIRRASSTIFLAKFMYVVVPGNPSFIHDSQTPCPKGDSSYQEFQESER